MTAMPIPIFHERYMNNNGVIHSNFREICGYARLSTITQTGPQWEPVHCAT